jgi:hypothetical protein
MRGQNNLSKGQDNLLEGVNMNFKDLSGRPDVVYKVVYKLVTGKIFYEHLDNYLDGELWFSDWHKFDDQREGKYLCSSSVDKTLRKKLEEAKCIYTVCSTTLSPDIFELWARFLENPPALCLVLRIDGLDTKEFNQDGLNTTGANKNVLNRDRLVKKDYGQFSGCLVDYRHKLKTSNELTGSDPDEKALEILSTKKIRYAYEEEYRLLRDDQNPAMHKTGEVKGIIIGGCCSKEDNAFNELQNKAEGKGIPIFHAVIDYTHESVEIRENVCSSCFQNLSLRAGSPPG